MSEREGEGGRKRGKDGEGGRKKRKTSKLKAQFKYL